MQRQVSLFSLSYDHHVGEEMAGSEQQWKEAQSKSKLTDDDIHKAKEMGRLKCTHYSIARISERIWMHKRDICKVVLMQYAKRLRVTSKIQTYMEILQ